MSYHGMGAGTSGGGFTLQLDTEAAKDVIAAAASDLKKCPEGERYNKSLDRCIPTQEAERVSPERECPEGYTYSKAMLEKGRDPCVPEVEARFIGESGSAISVSMEPSEDQAGPSVDAETDAHAKPSDRTWRIKEPKGYKVAPALEPKGVFCMQPYLTYEVPCTPENTERYLFPVEKYRAAQRRLKNLVDNPPKGMADPKVDNDTWAPELRTITGVSMSPKAIEKRGVGRRDMEVAEEVVNWIYAICKQIEAIYEYSNVSPYLLHARPADDGVGLKSNRMRTIETMFLPTGTKDVHGGIPILPPSLWGNTPIEWNNKTDEKYRAFLKGYRKLEFRAVVDIAATVDYRTRKWPNFTSGERRRAKRHCHKRDEFRYLPDGQRKKTGKSDDIRRRHLVKWFAETGGVVAKVRGRGTIERSRTHPKGHCGTTRGGHAITAGTAIHWYKQYAKYMSEVPINQLIGEAMRGYAAQLRYFLKTYEQDMSPAQTTQVVKAIKDAEKAEMKSFTDSASGIAGLIGNIYGIVFTALLAGLLQLLIKIGGVAVGGMYCPKIPFRRLIITKGCDPKFHDAPATVQLEVAEMLAPRGREMFDPWPEREAPPSSKDKAGFERYLPWVLGGLGVAGGGLLLYAAAKKRG